MNRKLLIQVLKKEGGDYCEIFISVIGDVEDVIYECVMGEDLEQVAIHAVKLWVKFFHGFDAVLRVEDGKKTKVKG